MGVDICVIFLWKHREQIYVGVAHDWQGWKTNLLLYGFLHYPPWKEELCPHRYLPLEASVTKKWVQNDVEFCRSEKVFSSLVRITCLSTFTIRPTLSSRAETTALNIFLTISVWLYFYSSDGDDRIKEFMYEFHNSIIYIPTLLDQRHRGRGLQIFGELPRENEGPATVIRNILALLFLRRNQMIELNQISVTNRSYCNTSRKNLVDNASCVWIVVLLQNIDDLIVDIYLAIPDICHFFYTGKIFGE